MTGTVNDLPPHPGGQDDAEQKKAADEFQAGRGYAVLGPFCRHAAFARGDAARQGDGRLLTVS